LLAANANDICTLDQIVAHVWGFGESGDTYLVKAHIRHLREKIEPVPGKPKFIVTSPGVGYMLKRHIIEGSLVAEAVYSSEELPELVSDTVLVRPSTARVIPGFVP
jgi:DNA-binding winged helix-turn-helix (wHTH) protein